MTISTTPRLNLPRSAAGPFAAMIGLEQRIDVEPGLRHLIKVRASQINGCAFCVDMHWNEARADGESEQRLAQLTAWWESPFFDDRERAALALTEAVTDVSRTHVPDDVWAGAQSHFQPQELAHMLFAIATINAWNRLMAATRAIPRSYLDEGSEEAA
jgi:AhpD family alkylhydroperoxidase